MLRNIFLICSILATTTRALDNGLAKVPPMGWNSWNTFACNIDQDLIVQTALKIKLLGLDKLGYRYVNIDDCWMDHNRTKDGKLIGHPERFSKGMKWMGDFLHEQGLLFGIYSSAGTLTCAEFPASLGHEEADAQTFAEWGVDYLKYDNCNNLGLKGIDRYAAMRNALNATGRPILFSLCQWGTEESWKWAKNFGNVWRTTGDITSAWWSIEGLFWQSQKHFEQSGPGAWLDPDMLEVGHKDLTSYEENKSHFALWVMAKAPLLLGNNLLEPMKPKILDIITNENLLNIHQDPDTPQATCYYGCRRDGKWCATAVDGPHVSAEDVYTCEVDSISIARNKTKEDFSVFAATRGGKHGGKTVVALIINWHDTATLKVEKLDMISILGIAPFPNQFVNITELWSGKQVFPSSLTATTGTDSETGTDAPSPKPQEVYFTFEDLKRVPIPHLKPHDSVVYSFTTMTSSPQ